MNNPLKNYLSLSLSLLQTARTPVLHAARKGWHTRKGRRQRLLWLWSVTSLIPYGCHGGVRVQRMVWGDTVEKQQRFPV